MNFLHCMTLIVIYLNYLHLLQFIFIQSLLLAGFELYLRCSKFLIRSSFKINTDSKVPKSRITSIFVLNVWTTWQIHSPVQRLINFCPHFHHTFCLEETAPMFNIVQKEDKIKKFTQTKIFINFPFITKTTKLTLFRCI